MFPRLGRAHADGTYARAAPTPPTREDRGRVSSEALRKIVAPVMRTAGVGEELCHPHVLPHTFATLYMRRDGARLEHLQRLMGHASIDTTGSTCTPPPTSSKPTPPPAPAAPAPLARDHGRRQR